MNNRAAMLIALLASASLVWGEEMAVPRLDWTAGFATVQSQFDLLRRVGGLDVEVPPRLAYARVTVTVEDATPLEAAQQIAKAAGCRLIQEAGRWRLQYDPAGPDLLFLTSDQIWARPPPPRHSMSFPFPASPWRYLGNSIPYPYGSMPQWHDAGHWNPINLSAIRRFHELLAPGSGATPGEVWGAGEDAIDEFERLTR